MLSLALLIALAGLIEARPTSMKPIVAFSNMIIGGQDASPGEFPWQLSQERSGSHSCGASLLANTKALTAAHCIDGAPVAIISVIAGLHNRNSPAGTQSSNAARLVLHGEYNTGAPTFSNDIGLIYLVTAITTGSGIQFATLPPNDNEDFAGVTCVISGWGRDSTSNTLPNTLQKASIGVLSLDQCRNQVGSIGNVWDGHICLYDPQENIGSCNGDSGGPLNCPLGGSTVVAGVTSWGVSSALGNCLQTYPSVYTRSSNYLAWIAAN